MVQLVAHISDPHLDGTAELRENFLAVIEQLRASTLPISAVAVTGDVIQDGAHEELQVVRDALAEGPPAIICPGNSDDRPEFAAVLRPDVTDGTESLNDVLELDRLRIVLLDSLIPGRVEGELPTTSVDWLADRLEERPGVPTFVGWHHPPVSLGYELIDPLLLRNPGPVARCLSEATDVVAVIVGHAHAAVASTFVGLPLLVAPGIRGELLPPFSPPKAGSPVLDYDRPPGFAMHLLHDDARVTTYFRTLRAAA